MVCQLKIIGRPCTKYQNGLSITSYWQTRDALHKRATITALYKWLRQCACACLMQFPAAPCIYLSVYQLFISHTQGIRYSSLTSKRLELIAGEWSWGLGTGQNGGQYTVFSILLLDGHIYVHRVYFFSFITAVIHSSCPSFVLNKFHNRPLHSPSLFLIHFYPIPRGPKTPIAR